MVVLTTRQRDLIRLLIDQDEPRGAAELAQQMQLTPRQVSYDLKGLDRWLTQHDVGLKVLPGVGVELQCSSEQRLRLRQELSGRSSFQLVLSVEQRQWLMAIILVTAKEPIILHQLQQLSQASRTTILKDLEVVSVWLDEMGLVLGRRQNYGFHVEGKESKKRQGISRLLWENSVIGESLVDLTHTKGLTFLLAGDKGLLPIVNDVHVMIKNWDIRKVSSWVAYAESQLGGRFTDNAVLYLALSFAIQAERAQKGQIVEVDDQTLEWLKALPVWSVASQIAERLSWYWSAEWPDSEIALVAMYLLAAPRNERWPADLEINGTFVDLIDEIMQHIATTYELPGLRHDKTLHDGIVNQIIPAWLRQHFDIWMPPLPLAGALPPKYHLEHNTAQEISHLILARCGQTIPESELSGLALLLRAAFVRERPQSTKEVIVICPSGMATAQLLVARLKVHFPHLGNFRVVSMRELSKRQMAGAQLIITTISLPDATDFGLEVIKVHPLLLPEDIERITRWLAR